MEIFKRITLWVSRALLHIEVSLWLSAVVFVILFGTAGPIKQTLEKTKVYDRLPDIALKQTSGVPSDGTVPLEDEVVTSLFKKEFPPSKLKAYSENFIDGMYSWLTGKTKEPNFRLDLSGVRESIAQGVAQRAVDRLNTLPPCTQIPSGSIDPFSIKCLPPGINVPREQQRIVNEMLANKDFLPNTIITHEQLPKTSDGRTFTDANKNAPKMFGLFLILPWVLAGLGAITSAVIIWLSKEKRLGIRTIGKIILINGAFVLVATLVFGLLLPSVSNSLKPHFAGDAAPLVNDAVKILLQELVRALFITSGGLTVLGGTILLGEKFIKPNLPDEKTEQISENTDLKTEPKLEEENSEKTTK